MVTVRIRSLVWFVTGAMLATAVTLMFINAWRVDAAPGDNDATLVPITPCRLVDTRKPGQTPLAAGETRTISAHGTNGPIAGSQCTIPTDAVGLSLNVTALDASEVTFWTISPTGVPRPDASSLNPAPGQPPTPNAVTTPISTAGRFDVFNSAGTAGILIDVNGYYTKSSLTELASRLAAVEAGSASNTSSLTTLSGRVSTNETNIAANTTGIAASETKAAALQAAQPFTVASEPTLARVAQSTPTAIRSVTLQAPVAGHVAVVATGTMEEPTEGENVICGLMDSVTEPPGTVLSYWRSSTPGIWSQVSASRVFDITAGATATYYLVCLNDSGDSTTIISPQVTAIFTPAA